MKILIAESESYLAQSILSKLQSIGYECAIAGTFTEAIEKGDFDVVLLSTTLTDQKFKNVLKHFKNRAIIILLNSYLTDDTVLKPIENGACDYVLKPFTTNDLVRKIEHFTRLRKLKTKYDLYSKYIKFLFEDIDISSELYYDKPPIFIKSKTQSTADYFAFEYAKINKYNLIFVDLLKGNLPKKIDEFSLVYAVNFHKLKNLLKHLYKIINLNRF
jgi:DNA-binding response OmpR family regulator